MKRAFLLVLGLVLVAAASVLNQGKPGTQGSWPVNVTSGGWTPDGGYIGTLVVSQGVGIDGGPSFNIVGAGSTSVQNWYLIDEIDFGAWLASGNTLTTTERIAIGYPSDGGAFGFEELASTTATTSYSVPMSRLPSGLLGVYLAVYVAGLNNAITCTFWVYGTEYGPLWDVTTNGRSAVTTAGNNFMSFVANGGGAVAFYRSVSTSGIYSYGAIPPAFTVGCTSPVGTLSSATKARFSLWGLR